MGSPHIKRSEFVPRRIFRGSHVQTLASFFLPRRIDLPLPEERYIEVEPGVCVLCQCHWQPNRQNALTVIIVHGLEGSSESQYMLGLTAKGLAAGMNVVRMNQRNCGGTDGLSPTLYHSGRSQDVAAVAQNLVDQDRVSRFALAGFSMGGNLVLKLAGEWSKDAPGQFVAVAAVCPSMDLAASADALHLPANRVYELYFVWKLRRRFLAKARLFPAQFDPTRLRGIASLRDFDDKITAYYSGFAGAADYYARAAAANVVDRIAVPTLVLHAANDPFIRILPATRQKIRANPHITFVETGDGGHCSFLAHPDGDDGRWAESKIVRFLQQFS
ncbi:MAG TPA: alpha/beta fold hydrolase [Terriglobales bacterium]|nr:alpha/beta fold hydrolase [Terriglobales bacterium]